MKKRFSAAVITALLLCLLLPSTAAADVIWEPYGNDFYDSHKDECRYEDEAYIINGGGGNVTALDQPDGKGKISIENGEQITVLFTYDNSGESWGVFEYRKDEAGEAVSAWVKMSELVKVYDGIDFFAEHESEITEIAGDGGGSYTYFEAENGKTLYFWTYPCSGEVFYDYKLNYGNEQVNYGETWTDPEGRNWAYIGYHQGIKGVWLCLSDPYNGEIEASLKHDYGDVFIDPKPAETNVGFDPAAAVIMAAAAVAIAGICIAVFWRKKK